MLCPIEMSLRPLLEIANEDERLRAFRSAVSESGATVDAYVSASLRPYLLAALIGGDDGRPPGPPWSSPPMTAPPVTSPAT